MVIDIHWQESFRAGEIIEEITCKGYKAILVKDASAQPKFQYPFRMFFSQQDATAPCLILSLEIGLRFGTCALGAHTQTEHINYGAAEHNMPPADFKSWALLTAERCFLSEDVTQAAFILRADNEEKIKKEKTLWRV